MSGRSDSEPRVTHPYILRGSPQVLPGYGAASATLSTSSAIRSYHFSMFFSLSVDIEDEALASADPNLTNNLNNLRDHDVGLFARITEFLGRGATFAVRKTSFPDSKNVALKSGMLTETPQPGGKTFMDLVNAIMLELRVLTHKPLTKHPNIIKLIRVCWEADPFVRSLKWPVLVVEYADQGTLEDYFDNHGPLAYASRLSLVQDILNGLLALHEHGIVHGDMKLCNVLVFTATDCSMPIAKLSDFGGALLDAPEERACPMCTPPWTAPEYQTLRTRSELLDSDIYALGLLIWRIMLQGANPFMEISSRQMPGNRDLQLKAIQEIKLEPRFFDVVSLSLTKSLEHSERVTVENALTHCLHVDPQQRDLYAVIDAFDTPKSPHLAETANEISHSTSVAVGNGEMDLGDRSSCDNDSEFEQSESDLSGAEDDALLARYGQLRLSLGGLNLGGVTNSLSPQVIQAFQETADQDKDQVLRIEAAVALATIHLGYYDFGMIPDAELALSYLVRSAEMGYIEHQGLVYRMFLAYHRDLPKSLEAKLGPWLLNAAKTGSMTAMEDLGELGYTNDLREARDLLNSRYCGYGVEIFEYDADAYNALTQSSDEKCKQYLLDEIGQAESSRNNLKEYHLRLAAAYGSTFAIEFLICETGARINDCNSQGDTALLFAARSGHRNALMKLLELGADPRIGNCTGDTPLHWLCSFSDQDVKEVATELVKKGANIEAQARVFPDEDELGQRLDYAETEFVAGTPLHRAICRNKLPQTRTLLSLGADVYAGSRDDQDMTPLGLAALLHYPDHLRECLSSKSTGCRNVLQLPSGKSILTLAISGGSLHRMMIGRLIRHGAKWESRAIATMETLLSIGAANHFRDLPGEPGCSALHIAVKYQPTIVRWLLDHGCKCDLNRPYGRFNTEDTLSEYDRKHPDIIPVKASDMAGHDLEEDWKFPLFEAISMNRPEMVQLLLANGADPVLHRNTANERTAFYLCAYANFENVTILQTLFSLGIGIDDGPRGYESPFQCAVRNGCFELASFLRNNGSDLNMLVTHGLFWRSLVPVTLLGVLVQENSPSSLSGLTFLLDRNAQGGKVEAVVEPQLGHTVFHKLAKLDGDKQDGLTTSRALALCTEYFQPTPNLLNAQSLPYQDGDDSVEGCGGNTALHYAVLKGNFEVVYYLLTATEAVDIQIENGMGLTALEVAQIIQNGFEERFSPRDIPTPRQKQFSDALLRRQQIIALLEN